MHTASAFEIASIVDAVYHSMCWTLVRTSVQMLWYGLCCPEKILQICHSPSELPPECWDAFDSDDDSSGHIEDEHNAIFDCSGYVYAKEHFKDLFQSHITSISQCQPVCGPAPRKREDI